MNKIGRNDPCWCGSGKKYKKCHLDRASQEKINPWDAIESYKKIFHTKKCFAKNSGLGECNGKIIRAHTVSRGPNLSKIAQSGKVITYRYDINKHDMLLRPIKIGISEASVFNGFCQKHDRVLFSCIENEKFTGRPDQCLAIAYRSISREFYGKDAQSQIEPVLRDSDKGKPLHEQIHTQELLDIINIGVNQSKIDINATHKKLTQAIIERNEKFLNSIIIEFNEIIPFMLAGAWTPFTDLFGNNIQDGRSPLPLEQLIVSSFIDKEFSYICISWVSTPNSPGDIISNQISNIPKEKLASICLQFFQKHLENIFYNPNWFNSLSDSNKSLISRLVQSGVDLYGSIPDAKLDFQNNLNLPSASSVRIIK